MLYFTFTYDSSRTKRVAKRTFTAIAGFRVDTFPVQTQLREELALIDNCNKKFGSVLDLTIRELHLLYRSHQAREDQLLRVNAP